MRHLPSLNSLRAFEAVARLLSVRAAAIELYVTPAAISKQIRVLEEHLKSSLFYRDNQRLSLTPTGEKYFLQVKLALEQLRNATLQIMENQNPTRLKIRSYTTFAVYWLIPRLSAFYTQHPNINIEITTTSTWKDIEQGDVDAAIRLGNGSWSGLNSYKLIPNILTPACSPCLAKQIKNPNDLKKYTLLHALARPDDWKHWIDHFGPTCLDPYSGSHYENSVLAYQAANQSQGVVIAQVGIMQPDINKSNLVFPFKERIDRGDHTYYLVTPKNKKHSLEFVIFKNWLLSSISDKDGTPLL